MRPVVRISCERDIRDFQTTASASFQSTKGASPAKIMRPAQNRLNSHDDISNFVNCIFFGGGVEMELHLPYAGVNVQLCVTLC